MTFDKAGTAALSSCLLLFGALPTAAAEEPSERIVVVGSRANAPQIAGDLNVPVDVFSAEDIARTGFSETGKVLQSLVPSFNFSISTISDGTDTVRPATLRGLWPDQVLVLVNGKRRHTSALVHVNGTVGRGTAGTDLNAIPPSAIARIEVLRDGAAAQYGSDAIAGVINIVLKSAAQGGEAGAYLGQTYKGDGEQLRASFNGGFAVWETGFVNITAERRNRNHTDRAGDDRYRVGEADSDNDYFFVNSELPLQDVGTLYAFGGVSRRDSRSPGFFRSPIPDPLPGECLDNDPGTDCPASPRNNNNIYPDGFLPFLEPEVDDESLTVGVKGDWGDWDWDASVSYGRNRFDFFIDNSLNVTLGDASPTQADSGGLEFAQTTWNFDMVRTLDWFAATFAGGLEYRVDDYDIHAGEPDSYRDGGEQEFPDFDAPAPPGIQVFPGFRPDNEVSEDRRSYAGYLDVEMHLTDRLRLGAALRYEDYDDFGDSLNGKLTGRYDLTEAFALRGAVSTGFRAPSLGQQYFNNVSTQFVDGVAFETGTLRNDDPFLRTVGVDELKEEESFHLSVGAVARPADNLTVSIDAYYIDIDDRITLSSQYALDDFAAGSPVRMEMERRNIGRFQFFTNAVDTYTRGLDLVADQFLGFDNGGTLRLSAAANVGSTSASKNVNEPPGLAATGKSVFDRRERIWLEDGQPHQHYTFAAYYTYSDYELNARTSRYGSVRSTDGDDNPAQKYQAKWITDVSVSRRFPQGVVWTVGVQNLFDVYPDRNDPDKVSNANIFPYSRRVSPFGINGGYYYTSLKYEFGS